jgi:hypothetical protein
MTVAIKIMNANEGQIRAVLDGLLNESEIDATIKRWEIAKAHIEELDKKNCLIPSSEMKLDFDKDDPSWGQKTHDDMKYENSYYGFLKEYIEHMKDQALNVKWEKHDKTKRKRSGAISRH